MALLVVYVGVTTQVAMTGSTDYAYDRAFEAHWSDVFRFALAWTNDWAEAEDLTQEAYLRLWNHRARLDWDRPVLPWLLVTVRRLATDRFRRIRRRLLAAPEPASLDAAVQARWLDVQAAMTELSPLERSALVMTAIEGATYEEAAVVLSTTAGALRAAVSRARTKLETA
ncbi:sigma-70 family RNA polymerase sigma factor [Pengzhenrongella sp.]|uniref:RNA polymerase sigma factor n=1 Tax=Pengzhenrongella sp. TaxID=2888820 RepID=UPI002F94E340